MEKTKLITMYIDKNQERVLKLRALSRGKTKSMLYRDIISKYLKDNEIC